MILFDHDGNEMQTDSEFEELTLGADDLEFQGDFRRLFKGTDLITHDEEMDPLTGKSHYFFGVRVRTPEGSGYKALVLAVSPDKMLPKGTMTDSEIIL